MRTNPLTATCYRLGMFGPRITTVFASRWKALWWSAGVLLTAYCSVPAPEAPPTPKQAAKVAAKADAAKGWWTK